MKNCKVAVAQIKVSDPETNVKKIVSYIKKASKEKADLVLFPETCVYVDTKSNPAKLPVYLEIIKNACKENDIWCIFTSYAMHRSKKYNTAFLINRNGDVVYKYNKMHLYGEEKECVTPGKKSRVINTEFGKIGILICLDIAFPEELKKLSNKGAWIIFCPVFEVDWESDEIPKTTALIRAYENICYVVVCDVCDKISPSISSIASPRKLLKQIIKKEGMIIEDLDFHYIEKLRSLEDPF